MRTRSALFTSCLFVVSTATLQAHAQAPQPPPPSAPQPAQNATDARALAETLFFTARGLMEAGRHAEACPKLAESYRLDAAPGTLLNLAVCNGKIGKTASAWGEFRDAQAEARRMSRPDREKLATDHIAALEPELSYLAISVPPLVRTLRGFEILRNGVPLQSAAWDTDLPVDPGDVEVIERAPLYKPKTLHVTVGAKEHAALTAVPLELAPIERPPQAFWTGRRTVGAVLAAVGVLAVVPGVVFGSSAMSKKTSSDNECPSYLGQLRCSQAGVSDMSTARTDAWLSDISFGLTVVGIGLGSYFFFSGGAQERPASALMGAGAWSWSVNSGPRGATGLLTHSF